MASSPIGAIEEVCVCCRCSQCMSSLRRQRHEEAIPVLFELLSVTLLQELCYVHDHIWVVWRLQQGERQTACQDRWDLTMLFEPEAFDCVFARVRDWLESACFGALGVAAGRFVSTALGTVPSAEKMGAGILTLAVDGTLVG